MLRSTCRCGHKTRSGRFKHAATADYRIICCFRDTVYMYIPATVYVYAKSVSFPRRSICATFENTRPVFCRQGRACATPPPPSVEMERRLPPQPMTSSPNDSMELTTDTLTDRTDWPFAAISSTHAQQQWELKM